MKIRTRITLFTSAMLIAMVVLVTVLDIHNIQTQGEERLEVYEQESLDNVKTHLQDLVDVAYETIDQNYQNLSNVEYLSGFYEGRLNNIIDAGEAIINRYKSQAERGQISLQVAKERAMNEIKALRFDGGTGYIWINDTQRPYPRMIMHPTVPELDGKILDDPQFNNAQGTTKNLFRAFVEVTSDDREGYVDYLWPKPTEDGVSDEYEPKLSYVRRYNDWGWIIGTGIYIDDAREEIEEQIKNAVKAMRYAEGTGYFWINDDTLPYPTMIMHPTLPALDGQVLDDPKFNNAQGVSKNLFQAFAEVTKENGTGFVDYLWPKPTPQGLTPDVPKMSYVRLHPEMRWIIGSGVYIDNIDEAVEIRRQEIALQVKDLIKNNLLASLIFLLFVIVLTHLFANSFSKPIRRLTEVAEQISKGKDLDLKIEETKRSDEIGELAKSIDRLKNSTKIMFNRLMAGSKKSK